MLMRTVGLVFITVLTMGSGAPGQTNDDPSASVDGTPRTEPAAPIHRGRSEQGSDPSLSTTTADQPADRVSPSATAAPADSGSALELALSDDYLQARYFTGGGLLGMDQAKGHVGLYFSDNRDIIGTVGLMTDLVPLLIDGLTFSAGARGYLGLLSDPDDDVFGLAPGAQARYALPFAHPVYAVGSIFYAPDILTLGDAERIFDLDLRAETQVVENLVGFIGFREFRFDSDEGSDKKAAEEFQVGARFAF